MTPHRGDVWLVDFGQPVGREQAGQRPGVILSSDLMNEGPAEIVVAVPCTTRFRGLPTQIELDPDDSGLDEVSYAKCEDVKSISKHRLIVRLGAAPPEAMFRIGSSVRLLLEL